MEPSSIELSNYPSSHEAQVSSASTFEAPDRINISEDYRLAEQAVAQALRSDDHEAPSHIESASSGELLSARLAEAARVSQLLEEQRSNYILTS